MIYFTSDLHFCHDKDFIYKPRGFSSCEEMNMSLIRIWNDTVTDDDDIYVLGDITLADAERGVGYWNELRGRKHIILGNHDSNRKIEMYRECPDTVIEGYAMPLRYGKYHFFLTHYPTITGNYDSEKSLKLRIIDLCGHTHTKDRFADSDKGLIYHVELDAHDNRPVSADEILEDIRSFTGYKIANDDDVEEPDEE